MKKCVPKKIMNQRKYNKSRKYLEWNNSKILLSKLMHIEQHLEILGFNNCIKTETKIENQWVMHSTSEDRERTTKLTLGIWKEGDKKNLG